MSKFKIDNKTFILNPENEHILGKGLILLLTKIDELSSVNKATKEMDLSYSKADRIISRSERALGFDLVIRRKGGVNRDGCLLTSRAKKIIQLYNEADLAVKELAQEKFAKLIEEIEN